MQLFEDLLFIILFFIQVHSYILFIILVFSIRLIFQIQSFSHTI